MNSTDFDKVSSYYDGFMKRLNLYRVDEIMERLELTREETVIDMGGGTGYLANHLQPFTKRMIIVDESVQMTDIAANNPAVEIVVADALKNKLESGIADIIILSDVYHHIKDQDALIKEMKRLLKPNGTVFIHDFDIRSPRTKLLRLFEYFLFGKLYFTNLDLLVRKLNAHGLTIIQSERKGYYFFIKGRKPC